MNIYSSKKYKLDLILSAALIIIGIVIIYRVRQLQINLVDDNELDPMTTWIKDHNSKQLLTGFWIAGIFWFVAIRKFIKGENNKERVKSIISNIDDKIKTADELVIGKSGETTDELYKVKYKESFAFHEELAASKGKQDIDDLGEYLFDYYKDSALGISDKFDLHSMNESSRYVIYIVYNKIKVD